MSILQANEIRTLDGEVVYEKGQTIANDSVSFLSQLLAVNSNAKAVVNVLNYHSGSEGGGGVFYWDATKAKSAHNGGTVIDPTAVFPTDWNNQTQLGTWLDTSNTGTGCWVRQYDGAVDVKWFGAVGDGSTDDSDSIISALENHQRVHASMGIYLVTKKLTLPASAVFTGDGGYDVLSTSKGTVLRKSASMTTALVEMTRDSVLDGIALIGVAGNLGDGLHIIGGRCTVTNVTSSSMGGNGITVGIEADSTNTNLFSITRVITRNNGGDGVLISSNYGAGVGVPEANAGTVTTLDSTSNAGNGLYCKAGLFNTFTHIHCQENGVDGMRFDAPSRYNSFYSGDLFEGNTQYDFNAGSGTYNMIFGLFEARESANINRGVTSNVYYGRDTTVGDLSVGRLQTTNSFNGVPDGVIVENRGNYASNRGTKLEFKNPDAGSSKNAATFTVLPTNSTNSKLTLALEQAGVHSDFLVMSPSFMSPAVDGGINLGFDSLRYSRIMLSVSVGKSAFPVPDGYFNNLFTDSGTVSVSDDRFKTYLPIEDVELIVAKELKLLIKKFKFNDAIEKKGIDGARIHYGTSAQEVKAVFEKHGLDAEDYGLLCYNEQEEVLEEVDKEGNVVQPYIPYSFKYGIRYEELLCFIVAGL